MTTPSDPFKVGDRVLVHREITKGPVTGRIIGTLSTRDWIVRLDGAGVTAHVPEAFLSHVDAMSFLASTADSLGATIQPTTYRLNTSRMT